ncbi:TfuA-like protein [Microlunatus sp. GCM10028923]|uniref:TfuA-like protein n=1 Tax=Microlunatus sp. GCM10028923 TaxID=3273400 RepID=UPI003612B070
MSADAVVFLGPSLACDRATTILDATYLPPVRAGDVLRVVEEIHPAFLLVIDGLFEQVASVRHKELLYALSQGVRVFGASSMGALRAAELGEFGMIGVGRVHDQYALGDIDGDDEVAISHSSADDGWQPLSESLVNIRWATGRAVTRGVISPAVQHQLVRHARRTYYPFRHWASCCDAALSGGAPAGEIADFRSFLAAEKPDVKALDAEDLLRRVRSEVEQRTGANRSPNFTLARTSELDGWLTDARPQG